MLKIEKQDQEGTVTIRLAGEIDENVDFIKAIGPISGRLRVLTREVSRINSAGIRQWILYFEDLRKNGVPFWFEECSPAVVDQINFISNFTAGAEVKSIYLPFTCDQCNSELMALVQCDELLRNKLQTPTLPCTKCPSTVRFDEIHDEYFGFLKRVRVK
jgi:hypothetical protein